jgi:Flp pilus assembly protein TadG
MRVPGSASNKPRRGQALVMVTLGLFAIIGLVGLGIDLSWSYFLEKTMQAAADSAALAAVDAAIDAAGLAGSVSCAGGAACYATQTSCASISSGTAAPACDYAKQNGFDPVANTSQQVTVVAADDATAPTVADATCSASGTIRRPPTAGCVDTVYWVTVRVSQQVPQLFSAILGNYTGTVSARATAAVARGVTIGSLILLNRAGDMPAGLPTTAPPRDTNLENVGSGYVRVPGGIVLSSNSSSSSQPAGRNQSASGYVESGFTKVATGGIIGGSHAANWTCASGLCPTPTPIGDPIFDDPMTAKGGQPPINTTAIFDGSVADNTIEVPGGVLTAAQCPGGICPAGIYYATDRSCPACAYRPSGIPIRTAVGANLTFNGGAFGEFMFIGGFHIQGGGGGTTINFGPGRYVLAGVADKRDPVFSVPNQVTLNNTSTTDAGRIFIFTSFGDGTGNDTGGGAMTETYPGMSTIYQEMRTYYQQPCGTPPCGWSATPFANTGLAYSDVDIQAGNNASSRVTLKGLDRLHASLPADLREFSPVVMWQDQANSYLNYSSTGQPLTGVSNTVSDSDSPQLRLIASPFADYAGVIYQPRGSWTNLQASGSYLGPLMIVTGAMKVQGSPDLTLTSTSTPITNFLAALIE